QSLTRAARLRPDDAGLAELARRVTRRAGDTPPDRPSGEGARGPQVGDALDGWQLVGLLGHGGWGQVFRATRAGEEAALKVLPAELSRDPAFVEHFKREIIALTRLGGPPHLVSVHNFGYAPDFGCWYYVMEYVEGGSLADRLQRQGPLPLGEA